MLSCEYNTYMFEGVGKKPNDANYVARKTCGKTKENYSCNSKYSEKLLEIIYMQLYNFKFTA